MSFVLFIILQNIYIKYNIIRNQFVVDKYETLPNVFHKLKKDIALNMKGNKNMIYSKAYQPFAFSKLYLNTSECKCVL